MPRSKEYIRANPERMREYHRVWRHRNRAKLRDYQRRKYRLQPEIRKASNRRWTIANQSKVSAANRLWKKANPEKVRASYRRYREHNPAKILELSVRGVMSRGTNVPRGYWPEKLVSLKIRAIKIKHYAKQNLHR